MTHNVRERGQILPWLAVLMIPLVGFVALGLDVGRSYMVSDILQTSVASAARAGALDLPATTAAEQSQAQADATQYMTAANFADSYQISFSQANFPLTQITVTATKSIPTLWGSVLGFTGESETQSATAAVGAITGVGQDLLPIGVELSGPITSQQAVQLVDGKGNNGSNGNSAPTITMVPLAIPPDTFTNELTYGYSGSPVSVGATLATQSGTKNTLDAEILNALESRANNDGGVSTYTATIPVYSSTRLFVLPVVTAPQNGQVTVEGFALFWLTDSYATLAGEHGQLSLDGEFVQRFITGPIDTAMTNDNFGLYGIQLQQ